jgi:hypothetical protein
MVLFIKDFDAQIGDYGKELTKLTGHWEKVNTERELDVLKKVETN